MTTRPNPPAPADIAIVGMGCLFPKASHLGAFWANIKHGVDAIIETPETHWRPEDYYDADPKRPDYTYGRRGGFLEPIDFNPLDYGMPPNALEATDTAQLLGMVAAERALQDAGYGKDLDFDRDRVSVVLGVTGALELVIPLGARLGHPKWREAMADAGLDRETIEDVLGRMADQYVPWQEASFPGLLGNVVAGRITKHLNLGGTNCVVDAACASSLSAVHLAMLELQSGKSDVVLSGGVDTFNDIFMFMCFSKTPALSPTGDAKPFDAAGDGTILGEGLGMVVLKRLADAERDNDRIYAVIKGIGASSDGKGDAIYAPSAPGQVKALKRAYEQAGIDPLTIELVEAHGTGTAKGDAVEISALSQVYGASETGPWCAIGSVKSQIGHTKAAAGSAALIKATLALYNKVLPPTIKVKQPLAPLREPQTPFYANTTLRPWLPREAHPRRAALSALGFGGSNFHCVLEEHGAEKPAPDWDGAVELLAFSGADATDLTRALDAFPANGSWVKTQLAARQLRADFDAAAPCRLLIVAQQHESNLDKLIAQAKTTLASKGASAPWALPTGIFFGCGAAPGKLAFVFPGQGTQYTGMLRDLACQFPEFLDVLARANAVYGGETARLSDRIYPVPAFSPEEEAEQMKALTATAVAPSAIGAVSAGALRVVERFGIAPDAIAGHSYGEIVGLLASGKVDEDAFHRLSKLRGALMGQGEGDKGAMMAVRATEADAETIIREENLDDVIIANKNAPEQMVLAGGTEAIARADKAFAARGVQTKILPVAAAFHSRYVSHVRDPFLEALRELDLREGDVTLYANTLAAPYPADREAAEILIAEQLAKPVAFVDQIRRMREDGVHTFFEIGPGSRISGLIDAILGDTPHRAVAVDSSGGKRDGVADLARAIAELAALGHRVNLAAWNDGCRIDPAALRPKAKLSVPLCGANHVTPRAKKPKAAPRPAVQAAAHARPSDNPMHSNPASHTPPTPAPQSVAPAAPHHPMEQHLIALQRMQQQTAELHRQFLEGQQAAMDTFRALLLGHTPDAVTAAAPARTAPAPIAPAPSPVISGATTSVPSPAPAAAPEAPSSRSTLPAAPAVADTSRIEAALLATIAEKTGYPADMLELSMSLDADLGIDSIKRVEILSALKERLPEAPEFGPDQLGQFHSLGDIVAFIGANTAAASACSPVSHAPAIDSSRIEAALLATIAEKTGYPADMLELSMSLDADLGIDSIKRVEILSALKERLPEAPEFGPDQLGQFHSLGDIVAYIGANTASATAQSASADRSPAHAGADTSQLETALLQVIDEKTGYPADMLELSMSLDADLGIDSIKRVEILSALKEKLPNIPEFGPEQLGQFHTLGDIVAYIGASAPSAPAAVAAPVAQSAPSPDNGQVEAALLATIAEKTGYPADMLELTMALDADLGIDSIKRVEILSALREKLPNIPEFGPDQLGQFQTLGDIVAYIGAGAPAATSAPPELPPAPTAAPVGDPLSIAALNAVDFELGAPVALPASGTVLLVASGDPLDATVADALHARGFTTHTVSWDGDPKKADANTPVGLVLIAPAGPCTGGYVPRAFDWIQTVGGHMQQAENPFLATVTQIDGAFGLNQAGENVESGALAGLLKTAAQEWPSLHSRALDIAAGTAPERLVEAMLAEGPVEIGVSPDRFSTLRLQPLDVPPAETDPVQPGEVIVISGGARGVTADVALAMAQAWKPTLVLLGRSDAPAPEEPWLQPLQSEQEIQQALIQQAGGALKPKELRERVDAILRNRAALRNIEAMEAAGATVEYFAADIRDRDAIVDLLDEVRGEYGPIRGIVHGAGVLADRLIADKTPEQFDRVYGTKVDGLNALLAAAASDDLRFIVCFSSSTGRFGRKGQVDYAAANEALNKCARREAQARPDCRVVSVNWGPWSGGMVTDDLARLFKAEGVGLIGLEDGARYLVDELRQPAPRPVEVVVMGGAIPEFNELPKPAAPARKTAAPAAMPAIEVDLSVEAFPFLRSHVLSNKAVLPVAMITEWFAHTALHAHPGFRFHGFDGLRVFKGVTLDATERVRLALCTGDMARTPDGYVVPVELRSNPNGDKEILHAAAEIHLADALPAAEARIKPANLQKKAYNNGGLYEGGHLFHGPAFQGLHAVDGAANDIIAALVGRAPAPKEWIVSPLRNTWLADPLILDSSFQMMILWTFRQYGVGSLPSYLTKYRQYANRFPQDGARILVQVTEHNKRKATADIEFVDSKTGALIARIDGYECTLGSFLNKAFQNNTLDAPATTGTATEQAHSTRQ